MPDMTPTMVMQKVAAVIRSSSCNLTSIALNHTIKTFSWCLKEKCIQRFADYGSPCFAEEAYAQYVVHSAALQKVSWSILLIWLTLISWFLWLSKSAKWRKPVTQADELEDIYSSWWAACLASLCKHAKNDCALVDGFCLCRLEAGFSLTCIHIVLCVIYILACNVLRTSAFVTEKKLYLLRMYLWCHTKASHADICRVGQTSDRVHMYIFFECPKQGNEKATFQ